MGESKGVPEGAVEIDVSGEGLAASGATRVAVASTGGVVSTSVSPTRHPLKSVLRQIEKLISQREI